MSSTTLIGNIDSNIFRPNQEQIECIAKVNKFIIECKGFSKLLINGSAGTGKTTIIISSIVNIILEQIYANIDTINALLAQNSTANGSYTHSKYNANSIWDKLDFITNFIVSAPTNKAKDVLVAKYNTYIEEQLDTIQSMKQSATQSATQSAKQIDKELIINILAKKIAFLTVSQVLSISRVINEMGVEEFTKGNDKKIIDKYNKGSFSNTIIIVDECSMIDTNTARLLSLIKCPIIYIGDYCQLPPVNEELSITFRLQDSSSISSISNTSNTNNTEYINLKIVERCKNSITLIANSLRDKIYDITLDFNLLKSKSTDLIIYNKTFSKWLEAYVADIKRKQLNLDTSMTSVATTSTTTTSVFDTMALGWTNKCCLYLNKKIRGLLFEGIKNIDSQYIIKGDKLLIKTPYYKYDTNICSSNIVYVSKVKKCKYKPLNFKDWSSIIIELSDLQTAKDIESGKVKANTKDSVVINTDIDLDIILETSTSTSIINAKPSAKPATPVKTKPATSKATKNKTPVNILDYFSKSEPSQDDSSTTTNTLPINEQAVKEQQERDTLAEFELHRKLFYKIHILNDIIANDAYDFRDVISLKYNLLIPSTALLDIKYLFTPTMRANAYTKWHMEMSKLLFGIPNDKISCKKCAFFVKKFFKGCEETQSGYISDFISETEKLELDIFLCDLATFTGNGKCITNNVPIININTNTTTNSNINTTGDSIHNTPTTKNPNRNTETIESLRNIIKNSYEVKIKLNRQEERELQSINKLLGEDNDMSGKSGSLSSSGQYITMSQMFGHYMSHILTSSYMEVDYGYALTVHKSQGSTYDDVYIEYSNILSNSKIVEGSKLLYTAITRGANKLHVYY